jgi:hypothetical protein
LLRDLAGRQAVEPELLERRYAFVGPAHDQPSSAWESRDGPPVVDPTFCVWTARRAVLLPDIVNLLLTGTIGAILSVHRFNILIPVPRHRFPPPIFTCALREQRRRRT